MSNLLDKASIVTTPTAYENGKILSVKPAPSLGSELVVNGDFATDSNWTKSANWTIANGKATSTGAGRMFQSIPFLETNIGTTVEVSFDITELTANSVVVNCYGGISESFTTVGTHTFTITTTNNTNLYFNNAGAGNLIGSIDNVSVKQLIDGDFDFTRNSSATRVNSEGLIEDVQILSSNLVSNGDFSQEGSQLVTNGDFATDLSGWNVTDGAAGIEITWTANGVSFITDGAGGGIQQSGILTIGKSYLIEFDYTAVSGAIKMLPYFADISETKRYSGYFVATTTNISFYRNLAGTEGVIDNVSVKEVGQDWNLGTGWSIGTNKAIANNVPNLQRLQRAGNNPSVIGNTYKYSINISNVSGFYSVYIFGVYVLATSNTEGIIEGEFTATSTNGAFWVAGASASGLISATIENITILEITEDTNLPRIDYTGGEGHWLFEPQSTNLVTYSEDFSQWGQSGAPALTSGQLAPDGTFGATKISGTIGSSYIALAQASTTTATRTIYAKTVSGTGTAKLMSYSGNTNNLFTLTEEWQRFELTGSSAVGATSFYIDLRDNAQTLSEFIIWGAQSEELSFATSYIPTNGNTVTRLQDAAFGAGSSDLINSTEGVLYAEIAALANDLTNKQISLNNGTTDDRIQLYYSASSNQISVFYKSQSGATAFILNHTLSDITQFNKVAFKWKQNDFALWSNGVEVATQTSGVTSIADTLTKLDFQQFNGSADFFGKTKCVAVFKEALTDAELTCLTTI